MCTINTGSIDWSSLVERAVLPDVSCEGHDNGTFSISIGDNAVRQFAIGFFAGVAFAIVSSPIESVIKTFVGVADLVDPFKAMSLADKIFMIPMGILVAPVSEELIFRGELEENLKTSFAALYERIGLPSENAARITAIFFSVVIFGLVHFTNVFSLNCAYVQLVPQVAICILGGFLLSAAKEATGSLAGPVGAHMGNNTLGVLALFV